MKVQAYVVALEAACCFDQPNKTHEVFKITKPCSQYLMEQTLVVEVAGKYDSTPKLWRRTRSISYCILFICNIYFQPLNKLQSAHVSNHLDQLMGYGPIGGYHNFKAGTFLLEPMRSITLAIDEVKFYNIVIINSFHRHA